MAEEVRRGNAAIHALATLLKSDTLSGADVARAVAHWNAELEMTLGATPRERAWREHFQKIVRAFGARLFPCYDHPLLPRTNNDMEQALRALSSRERRITGRKHIGPKLVRTGGLLGAAKWLIDRPDAGERIALLPDAERRGFQTRRTRQAKPRGQALAFRCKPVEFLSNAEHIT